jgi:hypothetical protein
VTGRKVTQIGKNNVNCEIKVGRKTSQKEVRNEERNKKKAMKEIVPVMSVMPLCSVSVCAVIACAMSADCFALKISLSEYLFKVKWTMSVIS